MAEQLWRAQQARPGACRGRASSARVCPCRLPRPCLVLSLPGVQWVVYDGKTEAEVDAEWAEGGEYNAVDLTVEMDEARTIAEALCAPAALS